MDGRLTGRLSLNRRVSGRLSVMPRTGPAPALVPLTVTGNGTYLPADAGADGFSRVLVDVGGGYPEYLYYRLLITDFSRNLSDGQTFQNIARFLVIGTDGRDLAERYGVGYAAVSEAEGSPAGNAFDGDPGTLWESDWRGAPDRTGWVRVRLDRPRPAAGFVLYTRADQRDYPHAALIQGSRDGDVWDTLVTVDESTAPRTGWQKGCARSFLVWGEG